MTQEQHEQDGESRYSSQAAIHAEAEHLSAYAEHIKVPAADAPSARGENVLTRHASVFAAGLFAATIVTARKRLQAHPHEADHYCREQAALSTAFEAALPPRLLRLWNAHYLDGQPLSACAASIGYDLAVAGVDYRDLLIELSKATLATRGSCQARQ